MGGKIQSSMGFTHIHIKDMHQVKKFKGMGLFGYCGLGLNGLG
jgi:hypothetical protein